MDYISNLSVLVYLVLMCLMDYYVKWFCLYFITVMLFCVNDLTLVTELICFIVLMFYVY